MHPQRDLIEAAQRVVEQIGYSNPVADLYQIVGSLKNPFPKRQSPTIQQKLNTTTPAIDSQIVRPGDTRKVGAGELPPVTGKKAPKTIGRELMDRLGVIDHLGRQRDTFRGLMTGEGDADDVKQIDRIISQGEAGARTGLRMQPERPDDPAFRVPGTVYDGYYDPTMTAPNVITRDQVKKDLEFTKERNQRMTRFIERNKDELSGKSPDEVERAFRDHEETLKSFTSHLKRGADPSYGSTRPDTTGKSPDQVEKEFRDDMEGFYGKRRIYPGTDER